MARILIVDDDEMERILLQASLERDHEMVFARSGEAAADVVSRQAIDLMITDLVMPEVNGLRLIKELREDGENLPIIAISGAAREQLDLAVRYGANAMLYKPVELASLLAAVNRLLAGTVGRWDAWGSYKAR